MSGPFSQISPKSYLEGRETIIAVVLTLVWVVVMLAYGAGYFGLFGDMSQPRDAAFLEVMFFLIVLILPLSMIWLVTAIMRRSFEIQDEARRLEQHVRELQSSSQSQNRISKHRIKDNRFESALQTINNLNERISFLENQTGNIQQNVVVEPDSAPISPPTPPVERQAIRRAVPSFPTPDSELGWPEILRALNFPNNESDAEGFRSLRLAKRDQEIGPLLRASEDMLNLLSQEGIYMEDMRPTIAPASVWRIFAHGGRGEEVAGIAGIDAPEAVERIQSRHVTDQIFRDTKLHFLRRFDIVLKSFADSAENTHIQQLADTRTGRAFMLLARASDMF